MLNKIRKIGFEQVKIDSGFWEQKQRMVYETTIWCVYNRFKETGRIDALKMEWTEGQPNKPHIFWDSDIAKWMESVAYIIKNKPDAELEQIVDDMVDIIELNQDKSGYFNTYFMVVEPDARFSRRTDHELYCAGHLIEAAVAYYEATGKDRFLKLMCKYADYIEKVFVQEKTSKFITDGHEEIELALVKLYRCTNEKRYLELSKFFIDKRGTTEEQYYPWANAKYAQDHLPVREQTTAEGHAVRAVYLYSAMADIAYEYGDQALFDACRKIFGNIVNRKMYITGGIGSSRHGEAFTKDYNLPNKTAYAESCAAIGLAFFADRMSLLEPDSIYGDIIEKIIYNGFLSSISLNGKAFFYENPLEIDPEITDKDTSLKTGGDRFPITKRRELFDCSCCPPNITRFIPAIGNFLYTYNNEVIFVNNYIESETNTVINGSKTTLTQKTEYPYDGKVIFNYEGDTESKVAFRIPGWCNNYSIKINDSNSPYKLINGYAYISLPKCATIELNFEMKIDFIEANPNVQENSGRCAVQRGPVIYCAEGIDNGRQLRDIRINRNAEYKVTFDENLGTPVILTQGRRRNTKDFNSLYRPLKIGFNDCVIKLIPYFTFANRGETEMAVWLNLDY